MTNKIIPSRNITVDTVKEALQNAFRNIRIYNPDPAVSHVFTVDFWDIDVTVSVDINRGTIKMFAFLYPQASSKEALILHANYLNNHYGWARFMVEENPYDDEDNYRIFADHILHETTVLNLHIFTRVLRKFHDTVSLAEREM